MKRRGWLALTAAAVASWASTGAAQEGAPPLSTCAEAVGAWLTVNRSADEGDAIESRSLFSFTADGLVLFADSGQSGGDGFAPFTGGHGAWRCVSSDDGMLRISATILDFTLVTPDWPDQRIGRLDIEATVDGSDGTMSGTMGLKLAPFAGNPLQDSDLEDAGTGPFDAIRITAP